MNRVAEDHFEQYFTEKIWEMIPSIYRHEDGLAERPGVLRAIVEIMANQAAIVRRSQDRLWEDQYIEWCSEWAVPYIADLVATRLLPLENKRGRRIDVAKTIYYRRRKGTPRVLEELISDIAGWDGKLVEKFKRLGRMRHGLDPFPKPLSGQFSKTPPGGWANLKNPNGSELVNGPFNEFYYTPDVRKHQGDNGKYNIPKLAFYLYRIKAYELKEVEPYASSSTADLYTFDPSGREIHLFIRRERPDSWENWDWNSAMEWEFPAPMRCRLLGHAVYQITEEVILQLLAPPPIITPAIAEELRYLRGWTFDTEQRLRETLTALINPALSTGQWLSIIEAALVEDCGKKKLTDHSVSVEVAGVLVTAGEIISGGLSNWSASVFAEKKLVIDPELGRFRFENLLAGTDSDDVLVNYHYGFSGKTGAGAYDRTIAELGTTFNLISGGISIPSAAIENNGVTEIEDNLTYPSIGNKNAIVSATIQAANQHRPYIRLSANWGLGGANNESCLVLDGLWIGALADQNFEIRLRGSYECVLIKNCTFDPGGTVNIDGEEINPVVLNIRASIEKLIIMSSITGPIMTSGSGGVKEVYIEDSIIQSVDDSIKAIELDQGTVEMNRVTVFGEVDVHQMYASEALLTDIATVTDTQNGCFRFSVGVRKKTGPGVFDESILPQPYESYILENAEHWFTSRLFGHYGYGQLSETAPQVIHRGAENKSEIGAFSSLINPIKQDSLAVKVAEYMPFGLIPLFINET